MRSTAMLLTAALLAATSPAMAQRRWDLSFGGGAAIPTRDLGNADLGTGAGFEATIGVRLVDRLAGYAGWSWRRFPTDATAASFAGPGVDVEETGYLVGLRWEQPLGGEGSPALRVRAGATLNHIEIEDQAGDIIADSGHGVGWEAGIGLGLPLGRRWALVPSVRYRTISRELTIGTVTTPVRLSYVGLDVGFGWSF